MKTKPTIRFLQSTLKLLLAQVAACAVLASVVVAVAPATSASAQDIGDGLLACSVGEICFKKHNDSQWDNDLKHFWWDDRDHNNNNWSGPQGGTVGENASMIWNRDTECDVYILDYKPFIGLFAYLRVGGAHWYLPLSGAGWNDRNDGHSRCGT